MKCETMATFLFVLSALPVVFCASNESVSDSTIPSPSDSAPGYNSTSAASATATLKLGEISTAAPGADATPATAVPTTPNPGIISTTAPGADATPATAVPTTPNPGSISTTAPGADATPATAVPTTPNPGIISNTGPGANPTSTAAVPTTPNPGSISTTGPGANPTSTAAVPTTPNPGSISTTAPGANATSTATVPTTPNPGSISTTGTGANATSTAAVPTTRKPGSISTTAPGANTTSTAAVPTTPKTSVPGDVKTTSSSDDLRPPKIFTCSGKVETIAWVPNYQFSYTQEYRELERKITREFETILRETLRNQFKFVELLRLWKGSVSFEVQVYLEALSNMTSGDLKKTLQHQGPGSSLNFTILDVHEASPTTVPVTTSRPAFEQWHLITWIISGIVVFFLLVVVCILQRQIKKLKNRPTRASSYLTSDPSLLTTGMYNADQQNTADPDGHLSIFGRDPDSRRGQNAEAVGLMTFSDSDNCQATPCADQKENKSADDGHNNPTFQVGDTEGDEVQQENSVGGVVSVETSVF